MRNLATKDALILDESTENNMTERSQSISPDIPVEEAMEIMTKRRFRHLPVMQNDRLFSIVSISDLVNYRIHRTERETELLKSYIRSCLAKKTIIWWGWARRRKRQAGQRPSLFPRKSM